ncbi:MAG: hypothetical protein JW801_19405 [Bacteroidales bacterium]|nr:hypothetical protein [Bacteroidales bacterium]
MTGQTLTYSAPKPIQAYRYIRVETTESTSWVAWREIIIHKTVTETHESPVSSAYAISDIRIAPNPINEETLLTYSIHKKTNVEIRLASIDGKINTVLPVNEQLPGSYSLLLRKYLPKRIKAGLCLLIIVTPESMRVQKIILPGNF